MSRTNEEIARSAVMRANGTQAIIEHLAERPHEAWPLWALNDYQVILAALNEANAQRDAENARLRARATFVEKWQLAPSIARERLLEVERDQLRTALDGAREALLCCNRTDLRVVEQALARIDEVTKGQP